MTTQEQQLIDGLVQRVNGTSLSDKDPDAEQRLRSGLGANPDALYILSQTVLVQQYALDQAKQQIEAARTEMDRLRGETAAPPPQKHTGFLESIFGSGGRTSTPQQQTAPNPSYSNVPSYAPPAPGGYAPQQSYPPPQAGYGMPMVGGGFLRGAAQTAAGVAAGALAFEGVESLLHGFGGGGMGMGGFGGEPREEVVNNYYGGDRGDRGEQGDQNDSRGFDDNNPNDPNPGDNVFTDSNDQSNTDDTSSFDGGSSTDDNGSTDDSSFDDSGSFDNSGDDSSF